MNRKRSRSDAVVTTSFFLSLGVSRLSRRSLCNKANASTRCTYLLCHTHGTPMRHNSAMPNPPKIRALCANECGCRIGPQNQYFCSLACKNQSYLRTVIEAWQNGVLPPRPFFSRVVRRHLLQSCSERCQRCGWSERNPYSGNSTLELEHIDGDWTNSHPSNLILLCPNCHSLTPTFRGLNRGRGRPGRPGHRHLGKPPLPPPAIPIVSARPADPSLFDLSPEAAGAT